MTKWKTSNYEEKNYGDEEIAFQECGYFKGADPAPLLDSDFDALWDAVPQEYPCVYFPKNIIKSEEE